MSDDLWKTMKWWVGVAAAFGGLAILYALIVDLPIVQHAYNPETTVDEYRQTILQAIGGLGILVGVAAALWRARATDKQAVAATDQAKAAMEGQIAERYTKAIEQLGSKELQVRLGGIYALERIAKDSPEHYHWTVMEVLTAFVRERAKWDEKNAYPYPQRVENMSYEEWRKVVNCWRDSLPRPATDIQAILTVLGRRDRREEGDRRLDLSGVDIRQADLREAHLEKANLRDAHLEGAEGIRVHLEGTTLICAHLEGAIFIDAHLERANLIDAHLKGTTLVRAHLEGADLSNAHLECANLVGAIGLTQGQIDSAILDKYTKLPSGLRYPALDRKEPEPS